MLSSEIPINEMPGETIS